MRKLYLGTAAALMTAPLSTLAAQAAPCVSAPVATYTASGFSCNVDGVTFSNFNVGTSGTGTVNLGNFSPFTLGNEFGLTLNYSSTASGTNQNADVSWTYTVAGNLLTDAFAQLTGNVTGTGSATLSEQLLNTGGTTIGSIVLTQPNTSSTINFSPIATLFVLKDQQNFSGTDGSAFTSLMTNAFSLTTVPAPAALPLFATGLLGGVLGWFRKKKAKARSDFAATA